MVFEVLTSRLRGGDNDVVALAHSDAEVGSVVGLDGHKVACNNLHGVVVDCEAEVSVSGTVDQAHAVASASDPVRLEARADNRTIVLGPGVGSVDQAVVARLHCRVSIAVPMHSGGSAMRHTGGPLVAARPARTSAVWWDQSLRKM